MRLGPAITGIVAVVTMHGSERMVAFRHHNNVAVFNRYRLVKPTVVCVDALESVALRRVEPMIIRLF